MIARGIANVLLVAPCEGAGIIMAWCFFVAPMLLGKARDWPDRKAWALEPEWDGYRMVAAVVGGRVRCWTRHGTDLTGRVGGVLGELRDPLPDGTLVDGELVALGSAPGGEVGQHFARLGQKVFGGHDHALTFVVFDALRVAGEQLTERPWHERRPHSRRSSLLAVDTSA